MVPRLDTQFTRDRARKLRKDPPASEKVLWQLIRGKQISGFKFGRRRIVLGWIPDFWCPAAKLVIEIDGDESAWKKDRDIRREKEFADEGIRTLHVSAKDIFLQPEKVVAQIRKALDATVLRVRRGSFKERI
jgi:very-short-patch-repair endonuclease